MFGHKITMNRITAWLKKAPATKAAWITAAVAILALLANTYVILQNSKNIKATQDMVILMRQANEISFRPFVQIEGLLPEQISEMTEMDLTLRPMSKQLALYLGLLKLVTNTCSIIYAISEKFRHIKSSTLLKSKLCMLMIKIVPIKKEIFTTSETLFPNEVSTRQSLLNKGVVITKDTNRQQIRVKLRIIYSGRDIDPNIYYYYVILKVNTSPDFETFNRRTFGNVLIEESDEGIESN